MILDVMLFVRDSSRLNSLAALVRFLGSISLLLLTFAAFPATTIAQTREAEDFDQYSVRVSAFWLYSSPTVGLEAAGHNGFIQFDKDFNFSEYSTFLGRLDWKLSRKNHLYLAAAPFTQTEQAVLNRTIVFRGQTFVVGAKAKGQLQATMYAPGYQYDIIRRKRGHLGIGAQVNVINTTGKISAAAQVTGSGVHQGAASSSASLLAPLPLALLEGRFYLTNSPRLFINGQVNGMYFGGYGYYASTVDYLGFSLSRHLSINGGYALGSRFKVNNKGNRIGLDLVQKGPIAGVEVSF